MEKKKKEKKKKKEIEFVTLYATLQSGFVTSKLIDRLFYLRKKKKERKRRRRRKKERKEKMVSSRNLKIDLENEDATAS